ncbi:MAG: hypothetical protein ACLSDJ_06410 [Butyricimonas faecihominis]
MPVVVGIDDFLFKDSLKSVSLLLRCRQQPKFVQPNTASWPVEGGNGMPEAFGRWLKSVIHQRGVDGNTDHGNWCHGSDMR